MEGGTTVNKRREEEYVGKHTHFRTREPSAMQRAAVSAGKAVGAVGAALLGSLAVARACRVHLARRRLRELPALGSLSES